MLALSIDIIHKVYLCTISLLMKKTASTKAAEEQIRDY